MEGIIKQQKDIAKELIEKLEIIDPHTILAGGAPRDWYFNKPCNDLDFYIYVPAKTVGSTELRFKRLGLDLNIVHRDDKGNQYKCMEHLRRVYEGVYKDTKYQVMVMTQPTFDSVIPHFGTSVCKAWWKCEDRGVQVTLDFLLSHYRKYIFKKDDYTAKTLHVDKMIQRYPDYRILDYSSLETEITKVARCLNVFPETYRIVQALKEKLDGKIK